MPSTTGQVYLGSSLINNLRFGNTAAWTRPTAWIAMPTIISTEQKVAALFLVGNNDSNFVAFRCSGSYTVDWGDGGAIENVASGVTAQHNYVFSNLSASTEFGPVGSKRRQAMIVITPQVGQNLTSISFNFRHSSLASTYTTPILEIKLSAPNCNSLLIGNTTGNLRLLEQCTILSHNTTNIGNMFNSCSSLQSVPLFNTAAVINMANMFQGCASLENVPLFNTAAVTNMSNMFQGCASLESIPLFDTAAVANMSLMFANCQSLKSVPLLNTAAVTNMANMFQSCTSLQSIPLFNTAAVENMANMFNACTSLQSVPLFDTAAVANMSLMFQNCLSLQSIPAFNCSISTNMALFASNCPSLKRCEATGIKSTVSFANCTISSNNLNEIYTNLADLTTLPTQTITVTGNYGVATDDPTIATAKNWTVTGI